MALFSTKVWLRLCSESCILFGSLLTFELTSVEQIKSSLATLTRAEQDEVTAYLFHLRHIDDVEYQRELAARLDDKNPDHWLTLEEVERRLGCE